MALAEQGYENQPEGIRPPDDGLPYVGLETLGRSLYVRFFRILHSY
jgi:hypothetical protein